MNEEDRIHPCKKSNFNNEWKKLDPSQQKSSKVHWLQGSG